MEEEIDALFRLPLAEFTPARNALAARLKKNGQQAEAKEVKALAKPSVPAWVVNQLYWQHKKPFERLIEASERVRKAQAKQKAHNSPEMREHREALREAQAELVKLAGDILRGAEHGDTRPMLRRVTTTLEALSTYGSQPDAPRAGRLTAELEPPGFDLLAGLMPANVGAVRSAGARERAPKPSPRKDTREEERRRAEAAAKAAVREAERELRAARTQAERTAAARDAAAKRERDTVARRAKAEKELARLATEADAAREAAREAAAAAEKAARARDNAERVLEEARRK